MISVVQRVSRASVSIAADGYRASIGPGLCVLLGVEQDDTEAEASWMAAKLAKLRIFRDDEDRMNRSHCTTHWILRNTQNSGVTSGFGLQNTTT